MPKKLTLPLLVMFVVTLAQGQVELELSVKNQTVSGSDFYFDIYLRRTASNAASGNLFLGHADFVLTFDTACFSNPVLSKYPAAAPGNCLLVPSNQGGNNIANTRNSYFSNLSTAIAGDQLLINLNGPAPTSQSGFNAGVAKVDQTPDVHRLGTFKITGLNSTSCLPSPVWKLTGSGYLTQVFSMGNTGTWISTQAQVVANPATPFCTNLTNPVHNAVNVPITSALTWAAALGSPSGYRLNVGTTPGGTDILNNFDVGNVTTYNPPGNFPAGTVIYVKVMPYNSGGISGGCFVESFTTLAVPNCTNLSAPVDGAVNVPASTLLTWLAATGNPTGYRLDIGTTPGGTDILNDYDLGNVTSYDPAGYLPYNTDIFVKIKPYNAAGQATGCAGESFTTANCIPNLVLVGLTVPEGVYKSSGELISNDALIGSGTTITFTSDTGVLLGSDFTVEHGAIFEVIIQTCPD